MQTQPSRVEQTVKKNKYHLCR